MKVKQYCCRDVFVRLVYTDSIGVALADNYWFLFSTKWQTFFYCTSPVFMDLPRLERRTITQGKGASRQITLLIVWYSKKFPIPKQMIKQNESLNRVKFAFYRNYINNANRKAVFSVYF